MGYFRSTKIPGKSGLLRRAKQGYTGIITNFGYSKITQDGVTAFRYARASIAPPPQAL